MNSMRNGPISMFVPGFTRCSSHGPADACSSSRRSTSASVNAVPYTGTLISLNRNGTAPMWSSWPCVRISARTLLAVLLEISEIRRDDVHAQQLGVGKHHSGVDHDDVVAVADGHGVHAELAQAAQRNQLQLVIRHLRFQGIR